MTVTIAIAGKGGTGKTTLAALLIDYLAEKGFGPILAIDGDPSSNLNLVLGMSLYDTVGQIREEALQQTQSGTFPVGFPKQDYLDLRIAESLVEGEAIDLLAMGRPEGPGCYCAANYMLRLCIDRLAANYNYVVIDNEAGMEHLSRRTTRDVNVLLLVSDPTVRGVLAAGRMKRLAEDLKTRVEAVYLVMNAVALERDKGGPALPPAVQESIQSEGLELIGVMPRDPLVPEFDAMGRPLVELPDDAPVRRAVVGIIAHLADVLMPQHLPPVSRRL